jgi:putative membrane protein
VSDGAQPSQPSVLPLDGRWRRLSPLSPLVRGGALAAGLIVVVPSLINSGGRQGRASAIGSALGVVAVIVISMLAAVVTWLVTRWRIDAGTLQIETGWIRRQSVRIPLQRIQAVDVVAPLLARLFGLAEVRIVSAGRGAERSRLAYLPADHAAAVRSQLLALAHGLDAQTPEPSAYPLLQVDNTRLAVAVLTRGAVALPFLVGAGILVVVITGGSAAAGAAAGLGGGLSVVFTMSFAAVQAFNADYSFRISEAADGFRLDRGLTQTRHETIPFGRVQAVRLVEPVLWRPFGWSRLEVDVARQHIRRRSDREGQTVARVLMPVAPREHVLWLLSRVMPHAQIAPPAGSRPPRRALLKAPFSWHFLAAWHDARYICTRTGRITASTVFLPLGKVQSVRRASGPLQRALRLATVHVDSAGHRWRAQARCRDEEESQTLLWNLVDDARAARQRPADDIGSIAAR